MLTHPQDDARQSLRAIDDAQSRLRGAILYGRVGSYLVAWGCVWLVGFVATFVWPDRSNAIWTVVSAFGWLATIALMALQTKALGTQGRGISIRYAGSAAVLTAYALMWVILLGSALPNKTLVYAGTVTGCAYLIAGIWRGELLTLLGSAVTVLFLAGLLMTPTWFTLYAGIVGGGGLIGAGLIFARKNPL